ncbi:Tn3 family transposase [Streptomyces sp. NPDC048256]|uniref:Tn3 family transposase n=1 Tax=Streptomyces sp. NPDC048256 TaxID=3154613 RepID=UPI0033CE133F
MPSNRSPVSQSRCCALIACPRTSGLTVPHGLSARRRQQADELTTDPTGPGQQPSQRSPRRPPKPHHRPPPSSWSGKLPAPDRRCWVPSRIRAHWGDMLRVAGSLTLGEVRGHDLIRMLSRDGKPTGPGDAFAHYGRIFKTRHLLQFVLDEGYRRMISAQLNVTEARHRLARKIFFGQRGELRQHYREGMEDQLGALGLALNSAVLFNSLYIDAAVKQLAADGFPVTDKLLRPSLPAPVRPHQLPRPLHLHPTCRAGAATATRPTHGRR